MKETGNLSINSENFLPIIKKWLYTEKEIFIRELVSNACDAVTKLQKLSMMGEADLPSDETFQIKVVADPEMKTLQIIDNGLGMTDEEIKKYINQIAFSGATDFLSKYEEATEGDGEIIGHFGLGFYSAFMVAEKVEIDTLSFQDGATAAKWSCEGGIDYAMDEGTRTERGTTITLFLSEDGEEFLEESTLYAALRKYCSFMPVAIFIDVVRPEAEEEEEKDNTIHISSEESKTLSPEEMMEKIDEKKAEQKEAAEPKPLNDTHPLWQKQPSDCTDQEYIDFYHKVFRDMNDPLFWIHLNMDYPFRLKGILYFPKFVDQMDMVEGEIKLYSNQVYIADNVKEVVPEFLLLLKGVLDCPDMPLNVSRSALQKDGYVEKMNQYITKKVGDKMVQLFKNQRDNYENFWDDISLFMKYGCLKEEKLYDKIKDVILMKTTDSAYLTVPEYLEKYKENHENKIFFVSDEVVQSQYIRLFKEENLEAVLFTAPIDKPFVSFLEYKLPGVKLQRIDADISDSLAKEDATDSEAKKQALEAQSEKVEKFFHEILGTEELHVKIQVLKAESVSSMLLLSEESRRMLEMFESYGKQGGMEGMFGELKRDETLVLNQTNPLITSFLEIYEKEEDKEDATILAKQVYDLALMSHRALSSEEMTEFIDRSNVIMQKLVAKK
ncbi:MAG: molecular chaperone HtpG [Bacillota bacterium]